MLLELPSYTLVCRLDAGAWRIGEIVSSLEFLRCNEHQFERCKTTVLSNFAVITVPISLSMIERPMKICSTVDTEIC
jgi:hypothetical protein